MKQLNSTQNALFLAGGALMVIGAGCFAFLLMQNIACWVYLIGSLMFAGIQASQTYNGNNPTISRLKRIMTLADCCFVVAGLLMVDNVYMLLRSAFANVFAYYEYVFNKWVMVLLIAALLEVYTMHRISSELAKEEKAVIDADTEPEA